MRFFHVIFLRFLKTFQKENFSFFEKSGFERRKKISKKNPENPEQKGRVETN
jgi:hypothetical protein